MSIHDSIDYELDGIERLPLPTYHEGRIFPRNFNAESFSALLA
jgi:hypothetical protein